MESVTGMGSAAKLIIKIYRRILVTIRRKLLKRTVKFEYKACWEERYKFGGNLGAGSYNENS
jgi:hypothetical protein